MTLQNSYDVIVAGAGPVGLFLAAELRRSGVAVAVIERLDGPSQQIKAGSVGPASTELLDQRGLLDQFPATDPDLFRQLNASRPVGHFAGLWLLRGTPEVRTLPLLVQQAQVEAVLERHARELGAVIIRGHELTGINHDGAQVTAAISPCTDDQATSTLHASYLVGCDGGRSLVRRLGGFGFPGTDPGITGRQALVDIAEPNPLEKGWHRTGQGMIVFGPGPSRVLTVEFDGPPADRDSPVTREEMEASLRRVSGTGVTVTRLHTGTRWTDNTRQADCYRRGRLLLAGDAAHIHPPFGGQGLNLGLQDAANLGWKLAAALAGHTSDAGQALLDSYSSERWPQAASALRNTRAQVALIRPDPQSGALRELFAELIDYDGPNQHLSALMTGADAPYPMDSDHPAAGRMVADRPVGQTRLYQLLRTPGGLLLDGSPGAHWSRAAAGRVRVIAGTPGADSLLVRPDGIVAWAAAEAEAATGTAQDTSKAHDQLAAALETWWPVP